MKVVGVVVIEVVGGGIKGEAEVRPVNVLIVGMRITRVDFFKDLYRKPTTHHINLREEENTSAFYNNFSQQSGLYS